MRIAGPEPTVEVLYGRHVSTSFLDLFSGHDEAGLSPNTKVFWLLNVLLAFVWGC